MAGECTTNWNPPEDWSEWVEWLSLGLHGRSRWRLPLIFIGVVLANGRRTVTSWLRAAGLSLEFREYYYFLYSIGQRIPQVAEQFLWLLITKLPIGERVLFALDDTPTTRYGPEVQGAGLHHNPTSSPDDHKFIYGHIWITLALVVRHPRWHTIAFPFWARLYVKAKDVDKLREHYEWQFQTKLELAGEMITQVAQRLQKAGKVVWVVMDGAYAYRPLLHVILPLGVVVVSRLRTDASLRTVPIPAKKGSKGARRKYGQERISLCKRAAQKSGWQEVECVLYGGQKITKTCKTFLATYHVVRGTLRVVLVKEANSWEVFFCTDPNATVAEILEAYADRSSIEQTFADVKESWGAGQQQVRDVSSNLASFHLNLWSYSLTELWSWSRCATTLRDRSKSPWDDAHRRPSHADRRKALRMAIIGDQIQVALAPKPDKRKIKKLFKTLAQLAA